MKKNNSVILILSLMIIITLIPSVLAEAGINVEVSKYEPYPATPGQVIKVWLLLENTGDIDAKDINVEIIPGQIFTPYNQDGSKTVNILGAYKDYLIDFDLLVADNAAQGYNNLKVKYNIKNGLVQEKDLSIYVQTKDSTLTIESAKLVPGEIAPGTNGKLKIVVKNNAPNTMTDLSMKLQLQTLIGSTIVDLPFATMDSGTERRVYLLEPGKTTEFEYTLRAYPEAVSKVYKIPFILNYYDSIGTLKTKTDYIGVIVNAEPDITVMIDKSEINKQKNTGTVTLKVINKGVNDIKFLNLILGTNNNFELLSNSPVTYVGNLVSDDYQTVEYIMSLKSTENSIKIPVTIQYQDANNKYYEKRFEVELNIIDTTKLNPKKGIAGYSWITIIVILLIAFGVWRYFKNKKAKNKKGQIY